MAAQQKTISPKIAASETTLMRLFASEIIFKLDHLLRSWDLRKKQLSLTFLHFNGRKSQRNTKGLFVERWCFRNIGQLTHEVNEDVFRSS